MNYAEESLRLHGEWKGKIEVKATVPVSTKDDLSLAYTPGVAQPCLEIQKDVEKSYDLTRRWAALVDEVPPLTALSRSEDHVLMLRQPIQIVPSVHRLDALRLVFHTPANELRIVQI